jgi:hypothetical protein
MVGTSGEVNGGSCGEGGRRGTFTDGVADYCTFWESHYEGCFGLRRGEVLWRGFVVVQKKRMFSGRVLFLYARSEAMDYKIAAESAGSTSPLCVVANEEARFTPSMILYG